MRSRRSSAEGGETDNLPRLVRQSRLPVVLFRLDAGEILEASDSFVALFGASREAMLTRVVLDFLVDEAGARARWALMEAGQLDGYHVIGRECRRLDGTEFTVDTSVKAYGEPENSRRAIGLLLAQPSEISLSGGLEDTTAAVVLGTVDSDWRIDRISAAVEQFLGHPPSDIVGKAIDTLVEPADLPRLLVGVGRGLQAPGGAMTRIRLRAADGKCRPCRMLVTRLAGSAAEGLGFGFAVTSDTPSGVVERAGELERTLQHIAREIEATGVLAGLWEMPATARLPASAGLSSREVEIVMRLLMGDRVPMIARQLFLSESTVRNHLTSVYRKLGVRSQTQLLSLLRAKQVDEKSGGFV